MAKAKKVCVIDASGKRHCGRLVTKSRKNPSDDDMVYGGRSLALRVLEWHGGQGTPLYAVGSSWFAGRDVSRDLVEQAASELRRTRKRAAISLAKELEAL